MGTWVIDSLLFWERKRIQRYEIEGPVCVWENLTRCTDSPNTPSLSNKIHLVKSFSRRKLFFPVSCYQPETKRQSNYIFQTYLVRLIKGGIKGNLWNSAGGTSDWFPCFIKADFPDLKKFLKCWVNFLLQIYWSQNLFCKLNQSIKSKLFQLYVTEVFLR